MKKDYVFVRNYCLKRGKIKMLKRIWKAGVVLVFMLCIMVTMNTVDVSAKNIHYGGVYKQKSNKAKYYLELREYDFPDSSGMVGNYYFVPRKRGYVCQNAEFWKIGKNTYMEECGEIQNGGYKLIFKVYKDRVVVKQKGTVLRGVNFSGLYKLKKRFPRT